MDNIFSGFNISDMTSQATNMFTGLAPLVELLCGILFAFFIIRFLVSLITKRNNRVFIDDDYDDDYDDPDFDY